MPMLSVRKAENRKANNNQCDMDSIWDRGKYALKLQTVMLLGVMEIEGSVR